eukprot:m51a1_g14110 hypothetical protein (1419) ;mRNA; r:115958-123848
MYEKWNRPPGKSAPDLGLHPVDRELETEILVRTALANHSIAASEKPYLLYSSQALGAGKTFFGEHAVPLLRDDLACGGPVTSALLDPPPQTPPEDDRANLCALRACQPRGTWTRQLVAGFAGACAVTVELKGIEPPTSSSRTTFEEALYRHIYASATGRIAAQTRHGGMWFLFFDEIGVVETPRFTEAFAQLKSAGATPHRNIFVFCAGKSVTLAQLALGKAGSPVRLVLLAMGPLQVSDIVQVMQCTRCNGGARLLGDELLARLKIRSLEDFARAVFVYTGGIGRLVKRTFETLLGAREQDVLAYDSIEDLMEGYVSHKILADTSAPLVTLPEDSGLRAAYTTALLFYITGTKFDGGLVVRLADGSSCPILDLVSQLCLYIKSVGSEFAFVFPKFTADWLSSCGDGVVSSMAGLMQYVSRFPAVLDRGHVLVLMLAQTLSIKLRSKDSYSDVGAFSRSESFKDRVINRTSTEGDFAIVPTPSFNSGVPEGKPSTFPDGRVHNFSTADWGLFSEKRLSTRTIGVPYDNNSVGHDLDVSDPSAPWALFALKNLQGAKGNGTSFKVIREEISKTLVSARASECEALGQRRIVLFIVSTRLTKSVESVLRHGSLSLGPGTWYKAKNGELVLLGKEAMEELFGRMQLEQLTKYFESPNDVKRCNALISYQFGQVTSSNPLFANPETKIDLEWLRAVFPKKDPNKLERWRKMLVEDNEVEDVGTLAVQKQESLERWGIPGAIAATLAEQAALPASSSSSSSPRPSSLTPPPLLLAAHAQPAPPAPRSRLSLIWSALPFARALSSLSATSSPASSPRAGPAAAPSSPAPSPALLPLAPATAEQRFVYGGPRHRQSRSLTIPASPVPSPSPPASPSAASAPPLAGQAASEAPAAAGEAAGAADATFAEPQPHRRSRSLASIASDGRARFARFARMLRDRARSGSRSSASASGSESSPASPSPALPLSHPPEPSMSSVFDSEAALLASHGRPPPPPPAGAVPAAEAWEPPVPAGWEERAEERTGAVYYVRASDGRAQWARPELEPGVAQRHRLAACVSLALCAGGGDEADAVLEALLCAHRRDFELVAPREVLDALAGPAGSAEATPAVVERTCAAVERWLAAYPEDFRDQSLADGVRQFAARLRESGGEDDAERIEDALRRSARRADGLAPKTPLCPGIMSPNRRYSCLAAAAGDSFNPLSVSPLAFARAVKHVHQTQFRAVSLRAAVLPAYRESATRMARQFDVLALWVVSHVLQQPCREARAKTLTFFVELADSLWDLRDYHGCLAVCAAVTSADVRALASAWQDVDRPVLRALDMLERRCDPGDGSYPRLWETLDAPSPTTPVPHVGSLRTIVERLVAAYEPPARCLHMGRLLRTVARLQGAEPLPLPSSLERAVAFLGDLERRVLPEDQRSELSAAIAANE